jgi:glycosyltransferase involved in cell wall biosynthesis
MQTLPEGRRPPPQVTVVLATYNDLRYLPEAVQSVVQQTMPDWELVIVDDGCTDGTREWLNTLTDARIRVVQQAHSGNVARLRNLGIAAGRAPWIAIQDSDDTWAPQKLERQLAYHREHPEFAWSYTGRALMNAAGARLPDQAYGEWKPVGGWIVREVLVFDAAIATPSMFFSRSIHERLGGFDEGLPEASEHLFRIDLAMRSECGVIAEPLVNIRLHRGSWTYRNGTTCAGLADVFAAFETRAPTPELAALSRRLEVRYRVRSAVYWTEAADWRNAGRALLTAIRKRPVQRYAYRTAIAWVAAMVRHTLGRARSRPDRRSSRR